MWVATGESWWYSSHHPNESDLLHLQYDVILHLMESYDNLNNYT